MVLSCKTYYLNNKTNKADISIGIHRKVHKKRTKKFSETGSKSSIDGLHIVFTDQHTVRGNEKWKLISIFYEKATNKLEMIMSIQC